MIVIYFLSALLLIGAVALLLGLTPERITDDLTRIITPEQSLRDRAKIAQGKKKSRKISQEFAGVQAALKASGKERQFTFVCTASLFLCVGGAVFALMLGNVFLMPVLASAMAMIPFLHIKSVLSYYQKHMEEEIETALSIISTAYVRSDNIVGAVSENIGYLKPPVKDVFQNFLTQATLINSNIKANLAALKGQIDNSIFREWCDCLIQCQDDRTMKMTLMPIVGKLTDVRIVNSELKTILAEPRKHKRYRPAVCPAPRRELGHARCRHLESMV